ncbi:lantibiotic dehydratase C-terminal domain-containing protein [Streptomyces yaizuensis]|uniref:Lantibiotic biosynthesis protein n=1 Tax=Streptomyces yaizuensis TaxID=2989713 RepID=A0ABQ5P277_9ACTN|nr:lantibiotic dehydratase C-terminal domain-containing protein [Streptomyces sp. YSPA8]GLF96709.1 lantibiotic biosynthesis protein [Streptomyces sp. YSPA8]
MTATAEDVWLSCHVFHHGDTDPLLTEALLPLVDDLRQDGRLRSHFFLRHWERGPHVRLRLKVPVGHRDGVRAETERRVGAYLERSPGPADTDPERLREALRRLSELEHGDTSDEVLRTPEPPNTLRWLDYHPELDKYGGPEGVAVAEGVFDTSSVLAGQVLRLGIADRARLGISLQLLLLASRALGLDPGERVLFLRTYHEQWAPYVTDQRILASWDRQYRLQRDTYTALVDGLDAGEAIGRGLGGSWERALGDALDRLRPMVASGRVWPAGTDRAAPPVVALASLVGQYLHTTNNRMNVRPQGECFVAYLAHRAAAERSAGHHPHPMPAVHDDTAHDRDERHVHQ